MKRSALNKYLTKLLSPYEFQDYGPNGLQIEGREDIKRIAFAVSATRDSIEKAIEFNACALIVHHGLFWKFHGVRTLTGPFAKRVLPLVKNEINLFGYHLPLDANMSVGNAKAIADRIGLEDLEPFGDYKGSPTGVKGRFPDAINKKDLKNKLKQVLDHDILHSDSGNEKINSMGIITGGANGEWYLAMREGLDSYLTGEMSEHDWHEAKEAGVHMFAGGHNATESLGIQELKKAVQTEFEVETLFIDSNNPA